MNQLADYEYNSSPTEKDFNDLIKLLNNNYGPNEYMAPTGGLQRTMDKLEDSLRRTGRTTRIIDDIIQDLFTKHGTWCTMEDHHKDGHDFLMKKVLKRLEMEHPGIIADPNFEIDMKGHRIRLIMDPKQLKAVTDRLNGVKM